MSQQATTSANENESEAKKRSMEAVIAKPDDIIKLNVGGKRVTTKLSTLCQIEGSLLSSMFSGRWKDRLKQDNDGYVFLDFNPKYFFLVLDYLREKLIATAAPAVLPEVEPNKKKSFNNFLINLGLQNEFEVGQPSCSFKHHSNQIEINEDSTVATNTRVQSIQLYINYNGFALSKNTYSKGVFCWRLLVEYSTETSTHEYDDSIEQQAEVFIGILKDNPVSTKLVKNCNKGEDVKSYKWNGSFGWILSPTGVESVLTKRTSTHFIPTDVEIVGGSAIVEITLNCTRGILTADFLSSERELTIPLPKQTKWKLHVNLSGKPGVSADTYTSVHILE